MCVCISYIYMCVCLCVYIYTTRPERIIYIYIYLHIQTSNALLIWLFHLVIYQICACLASCLALIGMDKDWFSRDWLARR